MRLNEITVDDTTESWAAMGFTVMDGYVQIGRSLRFKLTGGTGCGVLDYTFGDAGRQASQSVNINGLKTSITGLPDYLSAPVVKHRNGVVGSMKTVILANSADATTAQLLALMPELGQPAISNTSDTGIRYDYWTNLDETHFEVISMKDEVERDSVAVIFLFVDDLDAAIATFGETNVSAKTVYDGRDTVQVLPASGISASLRLITQTKNNSEPV